MWIISTSCVNGYCSNGSIDFLYVSLVDRSLLAIRRLVWRNNANNLMGGDSNRSNRGNFSFRYETSRWENKSGILMNIYSRPRGRGGRGRTSNKGKRMVLVASNLYKLTFIDSVHNTKAENRVQRIGQKSSTNESQQDHEISSSYKISSFQQTSRFNADQVEKKLQQRYDEAMYSALQNTSGEFTDK